MGWRAAALATVLGAGCATTRKPSEGSVQQGQILLAREDRVHNGVRDLLVKSGDADAEAARAGEVLAKDVARKARGAAKVTRPPACYAAGCWLEVQFEGNQEEIAKAAFELNRDVGEDRESAFTKWPGPRGRTALLRTDDGKIVEAWFLFVRGRSVSRATQEKQKIKLAAPMQVRAAGAQEAKP
jgi:outer membrane murein-binding lipoprotein Lpp